jgi:hypothetical protein
VNRQLTLQDSASKKLGRCVRAQAGRSGTITIDGSRNRSQAIRDLQSNSDWIDRVRCLQLLFLEMASGQGVDGPALHPCTKISCFLLPLGSLPAHGTTLVFLFLWLAAEL